MAVIAQLAIEFSNLAGNIEATLFAQQKGGLLHFRL